MLQYLLKNEVIESMFQGDYTSKVFYYIPPQIWASRKWRIKTVKKNISKVMTIFPFEKEMYEK